MKLTILKVHQGRRADFFYALRKFLPHLSLSAARDYADNLPYVEESWTVDEPHLREAFRDSCDFLYEKEEAELQHEKYLLEVEATQKAFQDAYDWYLTLPQDSRDKIDLLIQGSHPVG